MGAVSSGAIKRSGVGARLDKIIHVHLDFLRAAFTKFTTEMNQAGKLLWKVQSGYYMQRRQMIHNKLGKA